jgi:hypothetical protein
MVLCVSCHTVRGTMRSRLSVVLCSPCLRLPEYVLISKSKCKKDYKLSDNDFDGLTAYEGTCGYGAATYYTRNDVSRRACEKHNTTMENLNGVLQQMQQAKDLRKQALEEQRTARENDRENKRRTELSEELRLAGLELRSDSALCQQYIQGVSEHSLVYIVNRMSEMKYLFEYCHMDECRDIAYEEHCDELEAGYFPDCSVFDRAEEIALQKYSNGRYPVVFPWQKTLGNHPTIGNPSVEPKPSLSSKHMTQA